MATSLSWCSCLLMMCSVRGLVALATPARVSQDCKRQLGLSRPKQHAVCSLECMVSRYVLCFPQTTLGPLVHRNGLLVHRIVLAFFLAMSRSCTNAWGIVLPRRYDGNVFFCFFNVWSVGQYDFLCFLFLEKMYGASYSDDE